MIISKWMNWAVTGALAAAFPAVAMAHSHLHKSPTHLTSATARHAKTLAVHHHSAHKLSTKHRSASKLHSSGKKAKSLHSKRHTTVKMHSKKSVAAPMATTPGMH